MILRRLTKHVNDQNWFAVALDFVIVVFGVFIGLQVANWNEDRAQDTRESAFIVRLHADVVRLEQIRQPRTAERALFLEVRSAAIKRLFDPDGGQLSEAECNFFVSNPVTNPTDELAVVEELLNSEGLGIFSEATVSEALSSYLLARSRARDSSEGIAREILEIDQLFPDLVAVRQSYVSAIGYDDMRSVSVICDADEMRASQAFLNAVTSNEKNMSFHVSSNFDVSTALAELHSALDRELNTQHGEPPS